MRITLIAAVSDNHAIGLDNALAWDMPADRVFFAEQIRDRIVVMGRLTYEAHLAEESLPYRETVVITRQADYHANGAPVFHHLTDAYKYARDRGEESLFVLGGGQIYGQSMPDADALIITEIHTHLAGDAFFPAIDPTQWQEVRREGHAADAENPHAFDFVWYERR